ncbi:hypothetical protein PTW32_10865 [Dechloromonas agitata]|uniref:hypothetical protein n=1 Tax=Dechloromonas agitata TaxID=73030 RepID=UPI00237E6421|nr:hypothetical protein [Dechloromonas agitata]MDE1545921.1 hypothetical protein [Dechloromonas agitata]
MNQTRTPIRYALYSPDGKLIQHGTCHQETVENYRAMAGSNIFAEIPPNLVAARTWYDLAEQTPKAQTAFQFTQSASSAAVGQEVIISGLPAGTAMTIDGFTQLIEDGSAEITFERAGIYRVNLDHTQHLAKEIEIEIYG